MITTPIKGGLQVPRINTKGHRNPGSLSTILGLKVEIKRSEQANDRRVGLVGKARTRSGLLPDALVELVGDFQFDRWLIGQIELSLKICQLRSVCSC